MSPGFNHFMQTQFANIKHQLSMDVGEFVISTMHII